MPGDQLMAGDEQTAGEWVDGKFRFPLSKPIHAEDKSLTELVLREPTTDDVIKAGDPVKFDPISDPPSMDFDDARMAKMLSRLAEIPPSSIAKLATKDFAQLKWIIAPFFVPV
jgi:hypothetical protein